MSFRSRMRSLERDWLRPVARRLRLPRLGRGSRLAELEARVEELESLVRELTGLVSLQLDDEARRDSDSGSPRNSREAA